MVRGWEGLIDISRVMNMVRGKEKSTKKSTAAKQRGGKKNNAAAAHRGIASRPAVEVDFPLVGIGASAGGLEALQRFFRTLPPDCEAGFVVVQHLDPDHDSMLQPLLQRHTTMTVQEAADGMEVEAGNVYVPPPGKILLLAGSRLVLQERERQSIHRPIDVFFQSLAAVRGAKAIVIILSGAGSDGTVGVQEVKAAGGMCMVQDPDEAGHAGMPQSAIGSGLVDFILPVEKMGGELLRYIRHRSYGETGDPCPDHAAGGNEVQEILALLGRHLQYDFASYKQGTILRRIERRLSVRHVADLAAYRRLLEEDGDEMEALARDLLITVTSFFRDPEVFAFMAGRVFPEICRHAGPDLPVRIWVPGAATGEEAYSLAMVCFEALEELGKERCQLRIFATDVDSRALECARAGIYPASIAADVPATRLARFFDKYQEGYRVKKSLRQAVTFSVQNLIKDPPFAGLDLISCRNLLIYLTGETQRHILSLLHFALKPGGYLLLGSAEGVGKNADFFQPVDKKKRLFKKKEMLRPRFSGLTGDFVRPGRFDGPRTVKRPVLGIRKIAEKQLLKNFTPCAVVLNRQLEVLHFLGDTSFLQIPDGNPTTSLPAMLPPLYRNSVRSLLHGMIDSGGRKGEIVVSRSMSDEKRAGKTEIAAQRLLGAKEEEQLYLVVFRELPFVPSLTADALQENGTCGLHEQVIRQLEEELQFSHVSLENTIEQLEAANEELKASNEEAMAMNEEFLSTNEELESSREELQALNEELSTVNAQLEEKIASLEQSTGDFDNLLACGDVGAIFLDRELRVKKLTSAVNTFFPQLPLGIGKKIEDLAGAFGGLFRPEDVRQVLETLHPFEKEIKTADDKWCLSRALPYRTPDDTVGGVIVTFTDVTDIKKMELQASRRSGFLQLLTDALPVRMAYIDTEERYRYVNDLYFSWLGLPREKVIGHTLEEVLGDEVYPSIKSYVGLALAGKRSNFETALNYQGAGFRNVLVECAPHFDDNGKVIGAFGVVLDLTPRKEAERKNAWLAAIVQSSAEAIISKDFNGTVLSWNKAAERIYGYSADEMIGANISRIFPEGAIEEMKEVLEELRQGHQVQPFETRRRRKDGALVDVLLSFSPISDSSGTPVAVSVLASDISGRKKTERELQELNRTLEQKIAERTSSLEQHMVQLRRVAMELTQTEQRERERLSKVLHDDMQQLLVAAGLRLERLEAKVKAKNQREILQETTDLLGQASTVARNLAADLRPPVLTGASLTEGLRWLMEWIWQRFDLAVHLEIADNFNPSFLPAELAAYLLGVVRELLFNVVKHAQVKTARLKIGLDPRQCLVLSVVDHGVGSEKRQIEELETSSKGMGLRSIRERLELMGGTLSVITGAGKGFRVDILFPYPSAAENGVVCHPIANENETGPEPPVDKIRVMLVDDHRLVREGMRLVLEDEKGLEVVAEAGDGREAVQTAIQSRPDVIVMDVNMPELDGIEATRQIKQQLPKVSIIGLSMDGDANLVRTMLGAGACAYLEKDGPADELARTIRGCYREMKLDNHQEELSCRQKGEES